MATTNTNTGNETLLSTDIYEITEFFNRLRAEHISDLDETSSVVGLFGHMDEIFKQTTQDNLIVVSETVNEILPTRAKYTKNVITHALNAGITNIYASPAVMTIMIYLPLSYLEQNFTEIDQTTGKAKFILDKNVPIIMDEFEFHLDYDVILNRVKNANGQYVYTAMYNLFESGTTTVKQKNPISDITNPYITTVVQATIDKSKFIGFSVRVHQVTYQSILKRVVTDNTIENKTLTFEFDGQLANFDVDVKEGNVTTHLVPVYSGLLDYTVQDGTWFYYDYISEDIIRILFSRDSYVPGLNAEVIINVYVTRGASGNFTFNKPFRTALKSSRFNNYKGMYAYIYPLRNGVSAGGKDKKSIEELKKIIPRENASRGSIINTTDLENFFNTLNTEECRMFFKKKRDNPFERMYYAYMLMRKNGNVYPTNTINLRLTQDDFNSGSGNNNLVIKPGTVFYYWDHGKHDTKNDFATTTKPTIYESDDYDYPVTMNKDGKLVRVFEYMSPFLITIDEDLLSSYFMTCMSENKTFVFDSINTASDLQFVSTNMEWNRNYFKTTEDDDGSVYDTKYTMTVNVIQNNNTDYGLITATKDDDGNQVFEDNRTKMYLVLYADNTDSNPYRYIEGELTAYDESNHSMTYTFTFGTDDLMDLNNRINITGIKNCKPESFQTLSEIENAHGYMNRNTHAKLFILADFGTKAGDVLSDKTVVNASTEQIILYGDDGIGNRTEIESILPTKDDIIDQFLKNEISLTRDGEQIDVVSIMQSNESYMAVVMEYNEDESRSAASILKYIRNNKTSSFIRDILLNDADSVAVIDSYSYEDLSRYTVCNVMVINDGIDFYHDYTPMMHTDVTVAPITEKDDNGNTVYTTMSRYDEYGNTYRELKPVYKRNDNGNMILQYTLGRIPVLKNDFLTTEDLIQDFISDLNERRQYMEICLDYLEDTFSVDFKFINTWGPSRTFYYVIPSATSYNATVITKTLNVYSKANEDSTVVGQLNLDQEIIITNVSGVWGYIEEPYVGWVRLEDISRETTFIDNVAITLDFEARVQSSAYRDIGASITQYVKDFIEDINSINEIHMVNVTTYILSNFREQLVYFCFLGLNNFGRGCDHLYLYDEDSTSVDVVPEFINVACSDDGLFTPLVDIDIKN